MVGRDQLDKWPQVLIEDIENIIIRLRSLEAFYCEHNRSFKTWLKTKDCFCMSLAELMLMITPMTLFGGLNLFTNAGLCHIIAKDNCKNFLEYGLLGIMLCLYTVFAWFFSGSALLSKTLRYNTKAWASAANKLRESAFRRRFASKKGVVKYWFGLVLDRYDVRIYWKMQPNIIKETLPTSADRFFV